MKKIAVINDLSGFGKCSLAAAIPVISASGIQCCPLPTGIFSNQTGYESYESVDFTQHMQGFIEQWRLLNPHFDAILSGFISSSTQGKIISNFIDEFKSNNTLIVIDPVMGDDGEVYPCFDDEIIRAVIALAQKADIITPNLTELCIICNKNYSKISSLDENELFDTIKEMSKTLNKTVITTGIRLKNGNIANAVYNNNQFSVLTTKVIGGSFSGTGDILASYITAQAVNNVNIIDAVKNASEFISKAIADTIEQPNYNTADGINFEKFLKEI